MEVKKRKTLVELAVNEMGKVSRFTDQLLASRLLAMGILPGSQIQVLGKAPLNSGIYIKFDNQRVALRYKEAQSIVVSL